MPNIGTLVVWVYTSKSMLPVSDATVTVLQYESLTQQPNLVALRRTDRNGKTDAIPIETPSPNESLTPGDPLSYALCDLWVEHPDYQLMELRGVQVFPGVESIQEVPLVPLMKSQENYVGVEFVTFPPQDL